MALKKQMQYRFLGNSGLKVSVISFGAWINFGKSVGVKEAMEMFQTAYDAGVNFFDNAEVYGNGKAEEVMGEAFKQLDIDRTDIVVSTKIFLGGKGVNQIGLSRKHIIEGMHKSLARLQMDYVDVVFCHRPDPCTPLEETIRAMNFLINSGKAFYWGTSEWSSAEITRAVELCNRLGLIAPIVEQPQYNMFHRERFEVEYSEIYKEYKYGTTIWSPLASGLLTGKYNNGIPEGSRFADPETRYSWFGKLEDKEIISKLQELEKIAKSLNASLSQLALAWCVKNPNVSTVITGASKLWQLEENLRAITFVEALTDDVLKDIENVLENKPKQPQSWR